MANVEIERDAAAAWIWLNRPSRLNAIDEDLGTDLFNAVRAADLDSDIRTIVLAGRGRAFCAGDDLRANSSAAQSPTHASRTARYLNGPGRWPKVSALLTGMTKPSIAMLHGHAHGAGWDLALSCDFRVASEDLQVSHAYVRRGLASGVSRLPAYVGIGIATELLMLGRRLTAHEAADLGLISRVVSRDGLKTETRGLAHELAKGPTVTLGLLKSALDTVYAPGHSTRMAIQASIASDSLATEDAAEGRRAFAEKREPLFRGR